MYLCFHHCLGSVVATWTALVVVEGKPGLTVVHVVVHHLGGVGGTACEERGGGGAANSQHAGQPELVEAELGPGPGLDFHVGDEPDDVAPTRAGLDIAPGPPSVVEI